MARRSSSTSTRRWMIFIGPLSSLLLPLRLAMSVGDALRTPYSTLYSDTRQDVNHPLPQRDEFCLWTPRRLRHFLCRLDWLWRMLASSRVACTRTARERANRSCRACCRVSGGGVSKFSKHVWSNDGIRGALDSEVHGRPRWARREVPEACANHQGAVREAEGGVGGPREALRQLDHGQEQPQVFAESHSQSSSWPERSLRWNSFFSMMIFLEVKFQRPCLEARSVGFCSL